MAQLLNTARALGSYEGVDIEAVTELIVELTALRITKNADKAIWVNDNLEYTIEVTNIDESTPGVPVENVVVTDIIDPTIATLVMDSVTIDGNPAVSPDDFTFDPITGLLTIPLGNMASQETHIIIFEVRRAP